jgi:AraC-like DNA-binding protein
VKEVAVVEWSGRIDVAPTAAVYVGRGGVSAVHRHPAHKVLIGRALVELDDSTCSLDGALALPSGTAHRVRSQGSIGVVFLDARHFDWARAQRLARRCIRASASALLSDGLLEDLAREPARRVDPRLLRAIDAFEQGASIEAASQAYDLSASRLTHLVTDVLGAPPRAWRSWQRMRKAIARFSEGATVTHAAHDVGFADSAHLWRQCRALLGIAPSALAASQITHFA